jgi:uncharacterized protein YcbX
VLRHPDLPPLRLDPAAFPGEAAFDVALWRDAAPVRPCGEAADAWFTAVVGRPVRIGWLGDSLARRVGHDYGGPLSLADAAPLLVATTASLDALSARVGFPLAMARFRPNLVVDGATPWAEDTWRRIRVGGVEIELGWPCGRCVLTTRDPGTGAARPDGEPLATLARERAWRRPDGKREAIFAWNAIPLGDGLVRVGDRVEVLETRPPPTLESGCAPC